ncbi:MAG: hypothetical protein FWC77_01020 [Defluviitaleaceae bacterium]|nr:hypothetical protein [Defluviitaleaceae bacterium]
MNSKPKSFWRFYIIISLILAGAAALPLRNFGVMISIINRGIVFELPALFSVSSIIPFAAVLSAILIGFLFLPMLWKLSMTKRRIVVSVGAIIVFFVLGMYVETMAVRLDSVLAMAPHSEELAPSDETLPEQEIIPVVPNIIDPTLRSRAPSWIIENLEGLENRELIPAVPYVILPVIPTRSGIMLFQLPNGERIHVMPGVNAPEDFAFDIFASSGPAWIINNPAWFDMTTMHIPWAVRLHYYMFSAILILAVLNFLYSLAGVLYGDGRPGKRVVILHGIATGCYTLAYFFVRVMQYENRAVLLLTWGSVLNTAICFILAAVAVGLYCGSFMRYEGWGKIIPPISSAFTVLALYGAQYAMFGGNLYLYSEITAVNILLRILIIAIPGVVVYFLLRKCEKIGITKRLNLYGF